MLARNVASWVAVWALIVLVAGCGDDSHVRVSGAEGTIPRPGTFHGVTSRNEEISIRVGSIEQILFDCGNTPILHVFSPPEPVHDDGTFDVSFASTGRQFRVTGIFTTEEAAHGRIRDAQHQCDATFEVTRLPE